jgi:hypothetical protein
MKCFIKWIPEQEANLILLPESIIEEGEVIPRRMILQVGKWKKEFKVEVGSVPENTIGLSRALKLPFELPKHLPYELVMKGRNLHLGPIIAFMAFEKEREITPKSLNKYKDYLSNYSDIGGLIYIFAADSIHSTEQTIEGYYFDPNEIENETQWKYGFFPYPDVIYGRIEIEKQGYDQMISVVGENMFNSYKFDKWEIWQWLSPYPQLLKHLPYTEQLKNVQNLDEMLSKYEAVYVKPNSTGKDKVFCKLDKTGSAYHLIDKSLKETSFNSKEEVGEFLQGINTDESYLIQEAISIKRMEDSCFDFRVILQKNSSKHWNCTGVITRLRDTEGIAANFKSTGKSWTGKEALRKFFRMNDREVFIKEQEMINLCISAGKTLDKCGGNYGDLGIDLILDQNLKVWLIEIDLLHDLTLPLYSLEDKQMYLKVVTTPFEYAKSLAGFWGTVLQRLE